MAGNQSSKENDMTRRTRALIGILLLLCAAGALAQAPLQKDDRNCKDHPLFPDRMPGDYWIHSCKSSQFDAFQFTVAKGKKEAVEGQYWYLSYYPQASAQQKPSELMIQRNYENAVVKAGGTVVYSEKGRSTLKLTKDGQETWVQVGAEFTGKYSLTIVQKEAMAQAIVVDAAALADGLKTTGHIAVYDILFDTGKSDLKPESGKAIEEVAKLLKADPALKLHIVGHTDNEGTLDGNLKLSMARAQAVVGALTGTHGIAAGRLNPFGCGQYAPVANNDTPEGRAKNRRVELVKQ
jgi:outer membrane protein OmpA-like peptidoglycan-associated protein